MSTRDWREDRIGSADRGENPMFIAKMKSGYAFLGDSQFLPGYCVLTAWPEVTCLEDLEPARRSCFLDDMATLGAAISRICSPRRMNYSIYGNSLPILHAHVFPRYAWEPPDRIVGPVWLYPREAWTDAAKDPDFSKHIALRERILAALSAVQ